MSAFVVSDNHIHHILSWVNRNGGQRGFRQTAIEELQVIGQAFVNENYKSVNYRYNEQDEPEEYVLKLVNTSKMSAIEFIKLLDCLEYQCCETDDYDKSLTRQIVTDWRLKAIKLIPGYDSAAWDID